MPRRIPAAARKSLLGQLPAVPGSLRALGAEYLEWAKVKLFSADTLETYLAGLLRFVEWCETRGLVQATEVTRPLLERYQRHLFYYRKANGRPLSASTQRMLLSPLRTWFRWLVKRNFLLANPASEVELPRKPSTLPRGVLSPQEVERMLAKPDISTPLGLRDRALLETLYSTGLRRMEVATLKAYSIDFEKGTVLVLHGKGARDRLVPIGERALAWVGKYLEDARPQLSCSRDDGELFLTAFGDAFVPAALSALVRPYVREVAPVGSCHVFRHSMATAMLEGGADIRFIQAMLGHARLDTTQVYTQVSISKLKAVHDATHPGAKLHRKREEQLAVPVAESATAGISTTVALLDALDVEAGEEAAELE